MCSVILLRRPGHEWPLLIAANRDEMLSRSWKPPARHWPDRGDVVGGLDTVAGGSWMGVNDFGVVACILNRVGSLGPAAGKRSRGELVLDALDHPDAAAAAEALSALDPAAYRPFNMIVADNRDAVWIRNAEGAAEVHLFDLPAGLSMVTAHDVNDTNTPRVRRYLPRFRGAGVPDPSTGDWSAWRDVLADRRPGDPEDPRSALTISEDQGFGTSSASLLALPAPGRGAPGRGAPGRGGPVWLFAAGPADEAPFEPVDLG